MSMGRRAFLGCAVLLPHLAFADACSATGQAMQQSASAGLNKAQYQSVKDTK